MYNGSHRTDSEEYMICLFDEEEVRSEHDIAWLSKDWDAVQKLADSYKESAENVLFGLLNNINQSKPEMSVANIDQYSKYMIDNMLSKHVDCIDEVYTSNLILQGLSNQAHYNYMIHAIPRGKRFAKGGKLDESYKDKFVIALLKKHYQVNNDRAFEYKDLLSKKGVLSDVLRKCRGYVTDEFLKSVTKSVKEQKELKKMVSL